MGAYEVPGTSAIEVAGWEPTSEKLCARYRLPVTGPPGPFAPDGKSLLTWQDHPSQAVTIWDLASAKPRGAMRVDDDHERFSTMALSGDGRFVALCVDGMTTQRNVVIFDYTTYKEVRRVALPSGFVSQISLSHSGEILACVLGDQLALWDNDRRLPNINTRLPSLVLGVVSPDGRLIAVGGFRDWVELWSIPNRRLVAAFRGREPLSSTRRPMGGAFSAAGDVFAAQMLNGEVMVWRVPRVERGQAILPRRSTE